MENDLLFAHLRPLASMVISGYGCRQIKQYTAHFHATFKIVKGNLTFFAARHAMRTAGRKVTTGW